MCPVPKEKKNEKKKELQVVVTPEKCQKHMHAAAQNMKILGVCPLRDR